MKIVIPNWRRIACPKCGAQAGETCSFNGGDFWIAHAARRALADRTFGIYIPVVLTPQRKKTPAMRYWSTACQSGHPELCRGTRKARNGERGAKPCENPEHSKIAVDFLQA